MYTLARVLLPLSRPDAGTEADATKSVGTAGGCVTIMKLAGAKKV
jgi:hypothetical protein